MPFTNSNDRLTGRKPVVFPAGAENVTERDALTLSTGDLALNTVGNVTILPAGCVPVDLKVDADDMDTNGAPALVFSIGVSNGAVTNGVQSAAGTDISTAAVDGGAAWGTGLTVGQAGGQVQVLSKALSRVQPVNYDRYIVVKVTTAAATAASGVLGVQMTYGAP